MIFILSKILWGLALPANLLMLVLLVGCGLSASRNKRRQGQGRRICLATAVAMLVIGLVPIGAWMLAPLENAFPASVPTQIDGIILLGGDESPHISEVRHQPVVQESARRHIAFAALARLYPNAQLVFSGGSGRLVQDAVMKDADVAKQSLASMGVPVDRMIFEDQSRNTHENAVMSFDRVHPKPTQHWLLVTSAYHMPRAMACFRKAGWNVLPATTGYMTSGDVSPRVEFDLAKNLRYMGYAIHEYIGLIAYRMLGYTDSLWPR